MTTHVYFLTSVTNSRLPVFQTDTFKHILATAFNEARISGSFKILGYVIMPEHYHVVTDSVLKPSQVLRYFNGISARRVIDHLKKKRALILRFEAEKRRRQNEYKYSLWEHHSNTFIVTTESI